MTSETAPRRQPGWFGAAALFLFAVAWRLPYAVSRAFTEADELWYSLPTSERMARGEWLFYISGTNYGAPLQEFLASILLRFFGVSEATQRLPVVVIGALAVAVAYLSLRIVVKERVAFSLALLLALPSSGMAHYTAFAHPCYATTFLLCGAIQLLTFRLARARTAGGWWALAVTMGVALYVFKLSLLQSVASLAWLWWRSENAARMRAQAATAEGMRRLWQAGAVLATGAGLLAPVAYHYLTRRKTFVIAPWEKGLLLAALAVLAVGALLALRTMARPKAREIWPALACAAGLALIPLPAAMWFSRVELPRVMAKGGKIYAEASYELKHIQAWPHQARLVLQGIIPALVIGGFDELEGNPTETEPLRWQAGVSVALLGVFGWFGGRRLWATSGRFPLSAGDTVIIAPFLLTAAVMFPSWALHSECCFRYLLPFLPGGLLLAYRALEEPISRWPRVALGVVALLIVQNAADCYWHLR